MATQIPYAIAQPIVLVNIAEPLTRTALVNDLAAVLKSVGWTEVSITGGFRLLGVSPQGYSVYADIWDNGVSVSVQLVSTQSAAQGYEYHLEFPGTTYVWQIVAHPCGFAISRTDQDFTPGGTSVFAGIPQASQNCGIAAALPITEIWFSFGDYIASPFFTGTNPVTNLDIGDGRFGGNQTACLNGTLYPFDPANWSEPQIIRQSSGAPDSDSDQPDSHVQWYDGTDLLYPAFIAWGTGPDEPLMIQGEIYNAAVRSLPVPRYSERTWDELDWIAYTDEYFWGALWLVIDVPAASTLGNVAY